MKYITDNTVLKRYIPNVFAEVEGESTLFAKLTPFLRQAEAWMEYRIIRPAALSAEEGSGSGSGSGDDESLTTGLARQIVAAEAFRMAVPSLDLVLTPNGFGIVSNNTVAPASKERVAALIEGLVETRDAAIEQLAVAMKGSRHVLGGRVFEGYDLQRALGYDTHLLKHFLEDRQIEREAEKYVAEQAVSWSLMTELKRIAYDTPLAPDTLVILQDKVRTAIIERMRDSLRRPILAGIVEYIRRNKEAFPGWEDSEAAVYWTDRTFKNDKSKGGIWL